MSNYHPHTHDEDIPRLEPWLAVMASSLVPPVVALYLRGRFFLPLVVPTVVLFLVSLVMLRRQTVRRRVEQMHRSPEGRAGARSVAGDGLRMEGAEP